MRWSILLGAVLLFSLFLIMGGTAASPEEQKAPPDTSRDIIRPKPRQERALGGVLTIYIWRMTEAVGLTEEQAAQVFPKIREAFQTRWQSAAKRRRLLLTLQKVIDSVPHRKDGLERLLSQWEENEARLNASQREMLETLKKILTPEQQVKYLLFEEQFQGDLSKILQELRRERLRGLREAKPR